MPVARPTFSAPCLSPIPTSLSPLGFYGCGNVQNIAIPSPLLTWRWYFSEMVTTSPTPHALPVMWLWTLPLEGGGACDYSGSDTMGLPLGQKGQYSFCPVLLGCLVLVHGLHAAWKLKQPADEPTWWGPRREEESRCQPASHVVLCICSQLPPGDATWSRDESFSNFPIKCCCPSWRLRAK